MTEIINGTEINYETMGTGVHKVLLLHGWGCDLSLMRPVANALSDTHSLLLVDLPGHGKSGRPPEPWGVPEYAKTIKELLLRVSFSPCSVIAHSFGCRIATWLAADDQHIFNKIVFTGAAGIKPVPSPEAQKKSRRFKKLKAYCNAIEKMPLPGIASLAENWEEKLRQKYGSRDYNALDAEMRKTFVKVISLDLTDLYEKIAQSTLLIWGDQDTETPLWMGQKMETLIPDAGLVILQGGSHFAYLEQLQQFVIITRTFLKGDQ